jgi:hypothetical protein
LIADEGDTFSNSASISIMKRLASFILIASFLAWGSGTLMYWHNCEHAAEDAREDAAIKAAGGPVKPQEHDDSNCEVHAQLHMALLLTSWVPFVVCLGLLLGVLKLVCRILNPHPALICIDCRGPPVLPF